MKSWLRRHYTDGDDSEVRRDEPWRKYRIGIHSEAIRTNRAHANHPEPVQKRFVTCLMKNGKKSIRLNPRKQSEWIRTNSEQSFQSRSIGIIPTSDSFGLILIENSVWINPSSTWFGLIWIENLVSYSFGLLTRINSD